MNIKIENVDVVLTGLDQNMVEFEQKVNRLIQDAGMTGVGQAVSIVPVRTGHLQGSITYDSPDYLISEFYTDVYYSVFVEKGTSKMRAQPYMIPAFEIAKEKLLNDIRAL